MADEGCLVLRVIIGVDCIVMAKLRDEFGAVQLVNRMEQTSVQDACLITYLAATIA